MSEDMKDSLGELTIRELEEAAARVGAALKVLREAGALRLFDPPPQAPQLWTDGRNNVYWSGGKEEDPRPRPEWHKDWTPPPGHPLGSQVAQNAVPPRPAFSPEEQALRSKLLKSIRPEFPPEIEAAEKEAGR